MFHARWWDYSSKPMNLNGRIWIGNLILFGFASVIIVKWIAPHYFDFIETWNPFLLGVFAWAILACMLFDYTISHFLMNIVRRISRDQKIISKLSLNNCLRKITGCYAIVDIKPVNN